MSIQDGPPKASDQEASGRNETQFKVNESRPSAHLRHLKVCHLSDDLNAVRGTRSSAAELQDGTDNAHLAHGECNSATTGIADIEVLRPLRVLHKGQRAQ